VAHGRVTDYVGDDFAWFVVANENEAIQIKLGDHVKRTSDSLPKNRHSIRS